MATQDRNIHRDAKALRKSVTATVLTPGATDVDTPIFQIQPRYNYRVSDIQLYAAVIATAAVLVKAAVVRALAAVGTPLFGAGVAVVTFTIEAFWQNVAGVMTSIAATAAQAFTGTETVLAETWGVWTIQVNAAGTITTKAPSSTMSYGTEADALNNAPPPDALNGVVGILTLFTTGANFVAGTTNTDAAAVTSFKTANRDGHSGTLAVLATAQYIQGTKGQQLQDDAGERLLQGLGSDAITGAGDLLVVTSRSPGAAVVTNGQVTVDFRPFPAQGEGTQSSSSSQTGPQVP